MKNIAAVDLNLLKAFDALMEEKNVTRAAARAGMAQPSMSNALSRLRGLMNDELFVRTPGAMQPTELAISMAPHVSAALQAADLAVNAGQVFDPGTAKAEVILATTDSFDFIFTPKLVARLAAVAPGILIRTISFDRATYQELLDRQSIDLALGVIFSPPKRFSITKLYDESFVCIARKDHPSIRERLTRAAFLNAEHVLFSLRGDGRGVVDSMLESKGLSRKVAASIANYTSLPNLVINSDLIAVVAKRLALRASEHLPINLFPVPFEVPGFTMSMAWGAATEKDPLRTWLRNEILQLTRESARQGQG